MITLIRTIGCTILSVLVIIIASAIRVTGHYHFSWEQPHTNWELFVQTLPMATAVVVGFWSVCGAIVLITNAKEISAYVNRARLLYRRKLEEHARFQLEEQMRVGALLEKEGVLPKGNV